MAPASMHLNYDRQVQDVPCRAPKFPFRSQQRRFFACAIAVILRAAQCRHQHYMAVGAAEHPGHRVGGQSSEPKEPFQVVQPHHTTALLQNGWQDHGRRLAPERCDEHVVGEQGPDSFVGGAGLAGSGVPHHQHKTTPFDSGAKLLLDIPGNVRRHLINHRATFEISFQRRGRMHPQCDRVVQLTHPSQPPRRADGDDLFG